MSGIRLFSFLFLFLLLLNGKNEDMKLLWGRNLKTGDFSGLHAECLTDTWVGKDRWAFFDLSAGPFSWGPAVGGEGVRRELSLPNVEKAIGAVAGIEKSHERHIFCCMQSAAYWLGVGERTMQI